MEPREKVQAAQDEIDELNSEKRTIQRAWEGERDRLGDPELPKPLKLRSLNQELYHQYSYRDTLLKKYPELQAEFGTPGRKRNKQKSFSVCRSTITAADRARRKKLIHPDFKAWCGDQRPQIKCSLENWEDEAIQLRFLSDKILPPEFESWCGLVGIAFDLDACSDPDLTDACLNWPDFERFCHDAGFSAALADYRNDNIRTSCKEWCAEQKLMREVAEKREKEIAAERDAEVRRQAEALQATHLKERLSALPPSFPVFAVREWGVKDGDASAILLLWNSRDEELHALYDLWHKERVEAQKVS